MSFGRGPHSEGVAFHTPLSQWIFGVVKVVALSIILAMVIGSAFAALLVVPWSMNGPPAWLAISSLIACPLLVIVMAARLGRHELRRTIVLFSDELWIGGFVFGSAIAYDTVRLVRLAHPKKSMNKLSQVVIELRGRRTAWIWLREVDAVECFDALREFCDRAAAVGKHEELYRPRDPEFNMEATMVLAASLRRRAWRAFAFSGLILLWWSVMVLGVLLAGTRHGHSHGPAHLLVMLPIIAFGMAASGVRDRRAAKQHIVAARHSEIT